MTYLQYSDWEVIEPFCRIIIRLKLTNGQHYMTIFDRLYFRRVYGTSSRRHMV